MGHENTMLRPKAKGNLGKKQENNKGAQGSPLSTLLLIIYSDHMLEMSKEIQKDGKTTNKYRKSE